MKQTIGEYFSEFSRNGNWEIFRKKHKPLYELVDTCFEAQSISVENLKILEKLIDDYDKFIVNLPMVGGILNYIDFKAEYIRLKEQSVDFNKMDEWIWELQEMRLNMKSIYNYIALMTEKEE